MRTPDNRNELIIDNLGIARKVASGFTDPTKVFDEEDFVQIAVIGLMKGVDSFQPDRGAKLSTYAFNCAQNEVTSVIRKILNPTPKKHIFDGSAFSTMDDVLDRVELQSQATQVNNLWPILTEPERKVLVMRYLSDEDRNVTHREIGASMNLSERRIRQHEQSAFKKLRGEVVESEE